MHKCDDVPKRAAEYGSWSEEFAGIVYHKTPERRSDRRDLTSAEVNRFVWPGLSVNLNHALDVEVGRITAAAVAPDGTVVISFQLRTDSRRARVLASWVRSGFLAGLSIGHRICYQCGARQLHHVALCWKGARPNTVVLTLAMAGYLRLEEEDATATPSKSTDAYKAFVNASADQFVNASDSTFADGSLLEDFEPLCVTMSDSLLSPAAAAAAAAAPAAVSMDVSVDDMVANGGAGKRPLEDAVEPAAKEQRLAEEMSEVERLVAEHDARQGIELAERTGQLALAVDIAQTAISCIDMMAEGVTDASVKGPHEELKEMLRTLQVNASAKNFDDARAAVPGQFMKVLKASNALAVAQAFQENKAKTAANVANALLKRVADASSVNCSANITRRPQLSIVPQSMVLASGPTYGPAAAAAPAAAAPAARPALDIGQMTHRPSFVLSLIRSQNIPTAGAVRFASKNGDASSSSSGRS
jgi:hypothetical protein